MKGIIKNSFLFIIATIFCYSCADNDIAEERHSVTPPDLTKTSAMLSFSPDSGGVGTQLIIKGQNLGTDTSYLKVTVNGKNAPIIGVRDDYLYASVPARADTGLVKLYVKTTDGTYSAFSSSQLGTPDSLFRYQFKRNVSTVAGQSGQSGRVDGEYEAAKFQRPWFVFHDKDDVIYEIDEGRGTNKDGALRRLYEGQVETLIQDNQGPFQSPTSAVFNAAQDTMYMTHMYNSGNCTSKVGLVAITRASGFVDTNPLIRMDSPEPQFSGLAVNPKTGDVILSNNADGFLYQYTPSSDGNVDTSYKKLRRVRNAAGTEMRLVFSKDGKYLYEIMKNRHCICRTEYDIETHTLNTDYKKDVVFAGVWNQSGYQNGIGGAALFNTPSSGEFDKDGNLYVTDKGNHCIRKITPEGETSLFAGTPQTSGYKDGLPDVAKFNSPEGLTILSDQSIIVADRENSVIRKVVVE